MKHINRKPLLLASVLCPVLALGLLAAANPSYLTALNPANFLAAVSSTASKTVDISSLKIRQNSLNVFSLSPHPIFQLTAPNFSHIPLTKNPYVQPKKPVDIPTLFNSLLPKSNVPTVSVEKTIETKPAAVPTPLTSQIPFPALIQNPIAGGDTQGIINIHCTQKIGNLRKTVTGTGILINNDGTILTNAHVAQYPLVSGKVSTVTCLGRSGKVASQVLPLKTVFISPTWSEQNARYINTGGTLQTGSLDYALLKIDARNMTQLGLKPVDLSFDSPRIGSSILAKAYPADILATNANASLTLETEGLTVNQTDSLGHSDNKVHIIETSPSRLAQRGSSGGLISSFGNQMIAMITIVLEPRSPGQNRTIRAITPHHIDTDLLKYVSGGLDGISRTGSQVLETKFNQGEKARLMNLFAQYLSV